MVNTHCLPSGVLGTGELPVPNVSAANMSSLTPSVGSRRGVVVMLHGMTIKVADTVPIFGDLGGVQPILWLSLANALVADGWVVIQPQFADNFYPGAPPAGLFGDVSNDAGHGSRYLAQTLHWWDHVVSWIASNYGVWPIVPLGFSWGGWHSLQIAAGRPSTITAYVAHHPATVLSAVPAAVTTPTDFTGISTAGLDATSTMVNAVAAPGLIGWGTLDPVVGFAAIQAIYDTAHAAGAPVTSNAQATGHTLQTVDNTAITGWFTSVVDPIAGPAVL